MRLLQTTILVFLITAISANAQDITLPNISRPSLLSEGTETNLTAEQISLLTPWANDTKSSLTNLMTETEKLPVSEKLEVLTNEIKRIVGQSAGKRSELFMRYTLNRALIINAMMDQELTLGDAGTSDVKLRLIMTSIKMALHYHTTDINILTKKGHSPYAVFGIEYFNFLIHLNKSIFDASLQYTIAKNALEWLQWDLYRDMNNTKHAPYIFKINNYLKTLPSETTSDQNALNLIRQIRKFTSTLDILKSLENETEEIIGTPITTTLNIDTFITSGPETNSRVIGYYTKGSVVQILGSRVKTGLSDMIKIKIITVAESENNYYKSPAGVVGFTLVSFLKKPEANPMAFGQTYHVRVGGLFMKSTCGTVKKLGYRDVTFLEDGTIVKILDPKVVGFNGGMFVLVENEFIKVRVLKGSTKEGHAPTDCVGYAPLRLLEAEF